MSSSSAPQKKDKKGSGVISKAIATITGQKAPKTPKPLFQIDERVQEKKTRPPYFQEFRISQRSFNEFGRWQYKLHSQGWDVIADKPQNIGESDWIEEHKLKKNTTSGPYGK